MGAFTNNVLMCYSYVLFNPRRALRNHIHNMITSINHFELPTPSYNQILSLNII